MLPADFLHALGNQLRTAINQAGVNLHQPGAGGEIQLTDGIAALLNEEQVLAYRYAGTRYDCGSKLGYLQAAVAFGRRHPEVGAAFSDYLRNLDQA